LFLDEFPEVGVRVLEVMRQLMEDKVVTISRAWSLPSASGAAICRILRKQGSGKIRVGLVCVQ